MELVKSVHKRKLKKQIVTDTDEKRVVQDTVVEAEKEVATEVSEKDVEHVVENVEHVVENVEHVENVENKENVDTDISKQLILGGSIIVMGMCMFKLL